MLGVGGQLWQEHDEPIRTGSVSVREILSRLQFRVVQPAPRCLI